MKPLINIQNLHFAYNSVPILSAVDLQINEGEFLGIVGPNAGGKSTLLKIILGLLPVQQGKVEVLGISPRAASHAIGYVPQYPSFARDFPISVEQVVQLGLLGKKPKRLSSTDKQAIQQTLAEVEADNIAQRQIGSLSGGQLQRVLLARALVSQPRILIFASPNTHIDQRLESEIFDLLKIFNKRMTILVVSHDIAFISKYVNRVACINRTLVCHQTDTIDGQVIQDLYGEHVRMINHAHGH
jgi:zinc transport system ATP-binding protein